MNEMLEQTCKQFLDSLLANTNRHVLCLNIAEPGFAAETVAAEYLASKGSTVVAETEPTATKLSELLADIKGNVVVVSFQDLDKHPKCIDVLAEHAPKPFPGGRLVVVSRAWNSDNTPKERQLRKDCLFYQQALAKEPKKK